MQIKFKQGEEFDILQELRLAKDKEEQLTITAELHAIERWKLRMWLMQEGHLPYKMPDVIKAVEFYRGTNGRKPTSASMIRNYVPAFVAYRSKEMLEVIKDFAKMNTEGKRLEQKQQDENAQAVKPTVEAPEAPEQTKEPEKPKPNETAKKPMGPVRNRDLNKAEDAPAPKPTQKPPVPAVIAPQKWSAMVGVAQRELAQKKNDFKRKHDRIQELENDLKALRTEIDEIETFLELYGRE